MLQMLRVLDAAQVNKDDADQISLVILCNGIILASTKARATHLTTVVCVCVVPSFNFNPLNAAAHFQKLLKFVIIHVSL